MPTTYTGFGYRQSRNPSAPWIFAFVAPVEGIFEWAGIPRRSDANLSAFQRPEDPTRISQAKDFFNASINQSPTTIILGVHKSLAVTFRTGEQILDGIYQATLSITYNTSDNLDDLVSRLKGMITTRLNGPEESEAQDESEDEPSSEESEDSEEDEDSSADDDVIELGKSVLGRLLERLNDREWCLSNLDTIRDLAKPATIIDGQHRALAARACERGIPFSFTALIDCPWEEQVFQFTVVNYTSRKIPDQFITANAALSLTRQELSTLQGRLAQAGVKVIEYELMRVVNFDERSPFHEKVNLTEKKSADKIGYKTMVGLAKKWYSASPQVFKHILPNLYPQLKGRSAKSARLDRWRQDDWGTFFIDFWSTVYSHFKEKPSHDSGHTLWDVGHSNLIIAVVLLEFQERFFNHLNQQDEEFWDVKGSESPIIDIREKIKKRGQKFCEYLPPDFWASEWKTKSLNTGAGRKALSDCLKSLVDKKGLYQFTRSTLITGQTKE